MPQISPIIWTIPISILLIVLLSIKSNLTHTKENESLTQTNPLLNNNISWNW